MIFLAFFSNQPFAGQKFQNAKLKEWKFQKKVFGCIKQTFLKMIINKLAYETYEKYLTNGK